MSMTQAQFFTAVAEKAGISKAQAKAVFGAVEEVVMKSLKSAGKIPLGGLGAVKLQQRKARMGRNPATGEAIKIAAKTVVKIAPAKALKDAFNKKSKSRSRSTSPGACRTRSGRPSRFSGPSRRPGSSLTTPDPIRSLRRLFSRHLRPLCPITTTRPRTAARRRSRSCRRTRWPGSTPRSPSS